MTEVGVAGQEGLPHDQKTGVPRDQKTGVPRYQKTGVPHHQKNGDNRILGDDPGDRARW